MIQLVDILPPMDSPREQKPPRGRHVRELMEDMRRALKKYRKAAHASKRGSAKRSRAAFDVVVFEVTR